MIIVSTQKIELLYPDTPIAFFRMVLNDVIASKIKDILKKNPQGMNITQMFREMDIHRNTLSRYLDTLLVSGQVEMRRFGMGKIYTLSERVPLSEVLSISSELVIQLWANERAKRDFGSDLIGKKCYEVYHQRNEPCEPYPCSVLKAFRDGKMHQHEVTLIDKKGETRF